MLTRLRKILELETKKGFKDTAVVGGLDSFLQAARAASGLPRSSYAAQSIANLPAGGYRALNAQMREQWVNETMRGLSEAAIAAQPPRTTRKTAPPPARTTIDSPISALKGVRTPLAAKFEKLGIHTIRDLLYLFPRRHNDFSKLRTVGELTPGQEETVRARVWSANEKRLGRRMGTEASVGDESGMMKVVWFNQPFIARQLRTNADIVLSGRVSLHEGRPTFENPEWELLGEEETQTHTGRLIPVYPLTKGINGRTVRRLMAHALEQHTEQLCDPLPENLRRRLGLMDLHPAVRQAHYPNSEEELAEARRRLALDEMLPLQLSVLLRRQEWQQPGSADLLPMPPATRDAFVASLPFELTQAQQKSLNQLLADLRRDVPMSRLLQGDVGSGKTVVAAAGLVAAVSQGMQAVMMAPTEILAEQHFRTLCELFGADSDDAPVAEAAVGYLDRPLRIAILTGSLRKSQRTAIYEQIAAGEIDIAVGTHALIQEGVSVPNLGFIVVDEQHRFGVMQRAALRGKADRSVHMLVMTATPIPRSLYLTLFGDLDVSVIDELPPGRKPIRTRWWPPEERDEAYAFLREQVDRGRQAFVVCPLVEESAALQAKSAVQEYERLSTEVYPDLQLQLVHGRMSGKDKQAAMLRFRSGEAQILVSTSVVEVGVDIPNATVMLIEGADRFGLAQLHQFRGRVGRGADQSYCLLLSESPSEDAQRRLRLMESTSNGFKLAQADLEMRGPGEFFGTRQSGLPDFRIASLLDTKLIELARSEASAILEADPGLERPDHAELAKIVARLYQTVTGEVH